MEGNSLKLAATQKVPDLVVNKRMSQGEKVKEHERRKYQDGLLKK